MDLWTAKTFAKGLKDYRLDDYDAFKRESISGKPIEDEDIQVIILDSDYHSYLSKDKTYRIEQNNCRQRHWFARFRRRTLTVSRSLEMVEITMRIFAAIHVNKTLIINYAIFSYSSLYFFFNFM